MNYELEKLKERVTELEQKIMQISKIVLPVSSVYKTKLQPHQYCGYCGKKIDSVLFTCIDQYCPVKYSTNNRDLA